MSRRRAERRAFLDDAHVVAQRPPPRRLVGAGPELNRGHTRAWNTAQERGHEACILIASSWCWSLRSVPRVNSSHPVKYARGTLHIAS